jgi:hypothetical protein
VILKVLLTWLYSPGTLSGISNIVTPTATRMISRMAPKKLAISALLATILRSPSLPEKTQNVTKPNIGIKKLRIYTKYLDQPIIFLLLLFGNEIAFQYLPFLTGTYIYPISITPSKIKTDLHLRSVSLLTPQSPSNHI